MKKSQKILYSLITVILTVPLFVWYNLSREMGGMSNHIFVESIKIIPLEFVFAFPLAAFVAGPIAPKIAFSIVNPREEKPYIVTIAMVCANVILMCPMMSLISAALFNGITVEIIAQWMQNIVINFPFAFFTQLFFVQPIVKFIFKVLFEKKEAKEEEEYKTAQSM